MYVQVIVTTMAALALMAGIAAVCLAVVHATRRSLDLSAAVDHHVGPNGLALALVPATLATIGSLWLQLGAMKLVPCFWCWVQRGFVYPQVLILIAGLALPRSRRTMALVSVVLAAVGSLVSIYHMVIERQPSLATACDLAAGSCSTIQVEELGFVTIPTMALFVQLLILALAAFQAFPPRATAADGRGRAA